MMLYELGVIGALVIGLLLGFIIGLVLTTYLIASRGADNLLNKGIDQSKEMQSKEWQKKQRRKHN